MNTWQTELVKELKTVSKGLEEAAKPSQAVDQLISRLESVACNETDIASELNRLNLQWFARKLDALDFHDKARAENQRQE
jgi:hypothetical protein